MPLYWLQITTLFCTDGPSPSRANGRQNKIFGGYYMKSKVLFSIVASCLWYALPSVAQGLPTVSGCTADQFVMGDQVSLIQPAGANYSPRCLKVKAGAQVTIDASNRHPLMGMDAIDGVENTLGSQEFSTPQTRIYSVPGIYGYFCTAHGDSEGDGMAGAIWVE